MSLELPGRRSNVVRDDSFIVLMIHCGDPWKEKAKRKRGLGNHLPVHKESPSCIDRSPVEQGSCASGSGGRLTF